MYPQSSYIQHYVILVYVLQHTEILYTYILLHQCRKGQKKKENKTELALVLYKYTLVL